MKILKEGHRYELDSLERSNIQNLQFIEKKLVDGVFKTINDGTTNEEVLDVLINRLRYLNTKAPCRENSIVITKLEESLMWLNKRTEERIKQKVENTPLNHKDL